MTKKDKQLKVFTYLLKNQCKKCGEANPVCLEFHHKIREDKYKSISQMVRENYDWNKIENEIKKCEILCSNCHKKETAYQCKWKKLIEEEYYEENIYEEINMDGIEL